MESTRTDVWLRPALRFGCGFALPLLMLMSCSSDSTTRPGGDDTTPPGRVIDLEATADSSSVVVRWTAPGDDGATGRATRYELRYGASLLGDANWSQAQIVVGVPPPGEAGALEEFQVSSIQPGTWCFGLRTEDDEGNWSATSNSVCVEVANLSPPSRITDLRTISGTAVSVTLAWTAPGADGEVGQASEYDVRYATTPFDATGWDDAIHSSGEPVPGPSGTDERFTVESLDPNTTYYFGVRAADENAVWSTVSNIAEATTTELGELQLTFSTGDIGGADYPAWSQDGERVLFDANWRNAFHSDVYWVSRDGGAATRLTDNPECARRVEAAPDGGITYTACRADGIYTRQEIVTQSLAPGALPQILLSRVPRQIIGHAWHPSGRRIMYFSLVRVPAFLVDIYEYDLDTKEDRLMLPASASYSSFSWSPDGTTFAYGSDVEGSYDIWFWPEGQEPTRVTTGASNEIDPTWSPDGRFIAFASDEAGEYDIYMLEIATGDVTRLTDDEGRDEEPAWSPDGTQICFSRRHSEKTDIWVIDVAP